MPETNGYKEGVPCWVDVMIPDVGAAKRFYTELFGWTYLDTGPAGGGYQLATLNGKQVAGIGQKQPDQPGPSVWVTYLWADDADAAGARIAAAGGNVFMGPMDVPGAGRLALALDSAGAVFGIWQGREHRGAQLANEPGTFSWNENLSDSPDKAREFYRQAFGYTYEKFPDWPVEYDMFKVGGEVRGGVGAKPDSIPPGAPNFWNTYFSVADADAAVAAVTRNGGTVMFPPMDTPVGRMAAVTDPGGAGFCVISMPPSS